MSCWDTNACLKTLCTAYNDFQKTPCEATVKDLQRQIDVIVGVTSHGASLQDLSPKQMLYAESLSVFVSIINEPNLKTPLYLKAVTALSQLANDQQTREALQSTFNLVASLVNFVLRLQPNATKQIFSQTLNLLAKLTYRNKILNILSAQIFDFLKLIIRKIQTSSSSSDQCLPSLAILANLCHNHVEVQAHIKALNDVKVLYKTLFKYLSSTNKAYSITSLSILSSLIMEEESGEKIFSGNNLINIVHLVFQAVVTTDEITILQYSVDLIIDLLNHNKTFKIIAESNQLFETYVIRILNKLHSTNANVVIKVFELLNAFCSKGFTRHKLVTLLMRYLSSIDDDDETQMQDDSSLSPMQATLHWISQTESHSTSTNTAIVSAMEFSREVIAESIEMKMVVKLHNYCTQLIPICLSNLSTDMMCDEEKALKQISNRVSTSMELLIGLARDETTKQVLLERLNVNHISDLVQNIYGYYADDLKAERSPAIACSDEIVYVIFRAFELIACLKNCIPSGNEMYGRLLQDPRLLPFLSRGFSSISKYLVHASLRIFTEALKYKEFEIKSLGDSINTINKSRHHEMKKLRIGQPTDTHLIQQPVMAVPAAPFTDITNVKDMGNITALTEKLRKGLDIKDSKVSDIMDYYEHKLTALAGRERHLEDVIESKTQALSQSDRLLAQFRCRQAQADAECLKLRNLLKTSEKRCESGSVRMDQFFQTKSTLEKEIGELNKQLEVFMKDSERHKKLQYEFQEQAQKLDTMQKSLIASEEENSSLTAMNDCLHKNSEKLKSKLECSNERIKMVEGEVNKLNNKLKDHETIIQERSDVIKKGESMYQEKLNEMNNLNKEYKSLEKVLKSTEKSLHTSKMKISTLDSVIQEHEVNLKEKEEHIQSLQEEVDKHAQITAMINNLTSGRMNVAK